MSTTASSQRVTQKTLNSRVQRNLQRNVTAMGKLQEQLSSGRLIQRPSDSPTGTVASLRLRSDIRRSDQYRRNADDGMGWLGTADTTLTGTLDLVRSARDIVLQGANFATDDPARKALAAEVTQLRDHALALANTSYLGQPIFGGTASGNAAYDATGTYQGDAGTVERTLGAGVSVQVNVTGPAAFGPAGADLFKVLDDIAAHLTSGNTSSLSTTDLDAVDKTFLRLQDSLALVGARYHQVEAMGNRADSTKLDSTSQLSQVESIDLPQTIMELQLQEVAYQAALGAASRVIQPSLVDFLR
ncbi:MAG: flgL [Actinomycetia bacterium]|nr:flgL [Actinomycetes bacterium]